MSEERQEELLAIAKALLYLPAAGEPAARSGTPLRPRAIGQEEEPETQAEDEAEDWVSARSAQRGT